MTSLSQDRSFNDVKIIHRQTLFSGFSRVEKYSLQHRTFAGSWTEEYQREVVVRLDAAAALPYDPRVDKVILIEQFRAGALLSHQVSSPWLVEIVAGVMDKTGEKSESAEELIRREIKEEAGVEVEALLPVFAYFSSPGASSEMIKLFCAKVNAFAAPAFCGLPEEHEDIRVHVVPCAEAFAAVRSGRINNAMAIIALQWLEMNLASVRRQFGVSEDRR